jgi:hypothetical protein
VFIGGKADGIGGRGNSAGISIVPPVWARLIPRWDYKFRGKNSRP